ncbi:phosphotransferase [Drepanopeziza brunnea f. sp. 'multigermtubi' MB_m1]|uniref:Phosphotransferase n=1 Tax=Marssonina brunnea f. sp. multigermtubi (strain MB_m1) TaxID=1072389 RepID=K1XPG8_MARBU|nr:phosphotransferase [Drepanopeziza brunnea f. sp. 'multigermtubi' MB_m1]EKD14414.1 phosphotransferase [Drepanopeziza brunnea f. sp. 'multigermtubi' MB_m1]
MREHSSEDNLAWDKSDEASEISQKRLRRTGTSELAASLAAQKFGRKARFEPPLLISGYNILYRIQVEGLTPDVCHARRLYEKETHRDPRTGNILAGPTQFILDCPWWLVIEVPEMWKPDIDDWTQVYDLWLQIWLSALETAEKKRTKLALKLCL